MHEVNGEAVDHWMDVISPQCPPPHSLQYSKNVKNVKQMLNHIK